MSTLTVTHGYYSYKAKVSPSTLLNQVLTDSCKHFKLDENSYQLKYGKSNLDLSLPIRLIGLPFGAKIELVQSENKPASASPVVIKLQLSPPPEDKEYVPPDAKLLVGTFQSDQTLLSVLRQFEKQASIVIIDKQLSKKNYSVRQEIISTFHPIAQTIAKIVETDEDFNLSLNKLGMTKGNHVVRVRFKKTDTIVDIPENEINEDDNMEVDQREEEKDITPRVEKEEPLKTEKIEIIPTDKQESPEELKGKVQSIEESAQGKSVDIVEPIISEPHEKEVKVEVFKPSNTPLPVYEHEDKVYEMSVDQARLYQSLLSKKAHSGGMLTKRLREEQEMKNKRAKEKIAECTIRIRFPDDNFVQISLEATKTLGDLYNILVEKILILTDKQNSILDSNEREPVFKLLIPHPNEVILGSSEDLAKELVEDCNFGSRSLILYHDDEKDKLRQYIRDEYLSTAKSLIEAEEVQLEQQRGNLEDNSNVSPSEMASQAKKLSSSISSSFNDTSSGSSSSGKKVPKWLKLNKK